MADTVQMNLNVLPETKGRVAELADATFRGKGDVIDLAVAELYERVFGKRGVSVETPSVVIEQGA